jgi:hypothetical protein
MAVNIALYDNLERAGEEFQPIHDRVGACCDIENGTAAGSPAEQPTKDRLAPLIARWESHILPCRFNPKRDCLCSIISLRKRASG